MPKRLFTWREEDPSKRRVLESGTTFRSLYMEKFRSVWLKSRQGIKYGGQKYRKCNLGHSALFTGVNYYLSAELSQLSALGNAKRNDRPLLP